MAQHKKQPWEYPFSPYFLDKDVPIGEVTEIVPVRVDTIVLELTNEAYGSLIQAARLLALLEQRDIVKRDNLFDLENEVFANQAIRTGLYELLKHRTMITPKAGHNIYVDPNEDGTYTLPEQPVQFVKISEAQDLGYPVPDPLPDGWHLNDLWEVQYLPKAQKGDKGDDGQQGIQGIQGIQGAAGQNGQNGANGGIGPAGPIGPAGSDAVCGDCTGPITDPGSPPPPTPTGPGGGGGSGGDGNPNPDGKDIKVSPGTCVNIPALAHGPLGNGVEYVNVDIKDVIIEAAQGTGKFDPATEELVSVQLHQEAVCYSGRLSSITGFPIDIPLTSDARHATITTTLSNAKRGLGYNDTSADGTITVAPPDGYNLPDIGAKVSAGGRRYNNDMTIDMTGDLPVTYDGQFPQLPPWLTWLFTATLKTGPKTSAYHHMELCGLVKRKKPFGACPLLDGVHGVLKVPFDHQPGVYDGNDAALSHLYDNWGQYYDNVGPGMYRHAGARRAFNGVYGFKPNTNYGLRAQCYGGPVVHFAWFIQLTNFSDIGGVVAQPDVVGSADAIGPLVEWPHLNTGPNVDFCSEYAVTIYGPEWLNMVEIYEV